MAENIKLADPLILPNTSISLSAISHQLSAISHQSSAISYQSSAISYSLFLPNRAYIRQSHVVIIRSPIRKSGFMVEQNIEKTK
ncbi:hypothetical protein MTR_6g059895 [Medicago truncatula]|uniref:Uncharacterized protein n=1 Tax=Medicago truncatula TaxID=3880 RepID=A0A072UKT7_MEDTR|nr:hypothetical protein MTR_6g059895 [Medicago truncatula]